MTPEDLFWFIESISILFLISVSTWLEIEDKKLIENGNSKRITVMRPF